SFRARHPEPAWFRDRHRGHLADKAWQNPPKSESSASRLVLKAFYSNNGHPTDFTAFAALTLRPCRGRAAGWSAKIKNPAFASPLPPDHELKSNIQVT